MSDHGDLDELAGMLKQLCDAEVRTGCKVETVAQARTKFGEAIYWLRRARDERT